MNSMDVILNGPTATAPEFPDVANQHRATTIFLSLFMIVLVAVGAISIWFNVEGLLIVIASDCVGLAMLLLMLKWNIQSAKLRQVVHDSIECLREHPIDGEQLCFLTLPVSRGRMNDFNKAEYSVLGRRMREILNGLWKDVLASGPFIIPIVMQWAGRLTFVGALLILPVTIITITVLRAARLCVQNRRAANDESTVAVVLYHRSRCLGGATAVYLGRSFILCGTNTQIIRGCEGLVLCCKAMYGCDEVTQRFPLEDHHEDMVRNWLGQHNRGVAFGFE